MSESTNADQATKLHDLQEVTGLPEAQAKTLLEAANWDVEVATNLFLSQNEMDVDSENDEDVSDDDAAQPSSSDPAKGSAAAGPVKGTGPAKAGPSKFATFSDIKATAESEDEDEKKQDMFAGGEKSGIAVQNPDPIKRIFQKAAQPSEWSDDEEQERQPGQASRFVGSGRTLGSEDTAPPAAAAPRPAPRQQEEIVQRELIFWKDGFSVGDGPLLRYDDPANKEVLKLIESGRAPSALLNVAYGQKAEVSLTKRMDENYTPPKKVWKAFEGRGNRLGSPTPGTASSSYTPPPPVSPAPAAAPVAATDAKVEVDSAAPTTTLQIRLADGTRLRSRFNHTHTVGDLYQFVNAASRESTQREYILQTAFPSIKDLTDKAKTLKDEGLLQSTVMQKWK